MVVEEEELVMDVEVMVSSWSGGRGGGGGEEVKRWCWQ